MNLRTLKIYLVPFLFFLIIALICVYLATDFFSSNHFKKENLKTINVNLPTIINGELYVPSSTISAKTSNISTNSKIGVVSINLAAITSQDGQITGIRAVGEVVNKEHNFINEMIPIAKFIDNQGNIISQKIGRLNANFRFPSIPENGKSAYDVVFEYPPVSEKIELFFNVASASSFPEFVPLKIASRSMEIKSVDNEGKKIDYYIISGNVVNPYESSISDISVISYTKDKEDKIYSLGNTNFKNDLLSKDQKIDFKIPLIPFRTDFIYESYEIFAWGKYYP